MTLITLTLLQLMLGKIVSQHEAITTTKATYTIQQGSDCKVPGDKLCTAVYSAEGEIIQVLYKP
jgi:hypothetical protein